MVTDPTSAAKATVATNAASSICDRGGRRPSPPRRAPRAASSVAPYSSFLLFLAMALPILLLFPAPAVSGPLRSTTVIIRSADGMDFTSDLLAEDFTDDGEGTPCNYSGGTLTLSHPMSLKPRDKFFSTGQLQLRAIEMILDAINSSPRCGVSVGGERHSLMLRTYGDDSSGAKVAAITKNSVGTVDYFLGPYSSGLTGKMSPIANDTNTILLAGGAASTAVFSGNPTVFGTFPPTKKYLAQAVEGLANMSAKTVVGIWEYASFT